LKSFATKNQHKPYHGPIINTESLYSRHRHGIFWPLESRHFVSILCTLFSSFRFGALSIVGLRLGLVVGSGSVLV